MRADTPAESLSSLIWAGRARGEAAVARLPRGETAQKYRAQAAELGRNERVTRGFIMSAETFERLGRRCTEMTGPQP